MHDLLRGDDLNGKLQDCNKIYVCIQFVYHAETDAVRDAMLLLNKQSRAKHIQPRCLDEHVPLTPYLSFADENKDKSMRKALMQSKLYAAVSTTLIMWKKL